MCYTTHPVIKRYVKRAPEGHGNIVDELKLSCLITTSKRVVYDLSKRCHVLSCYALDNLKS